MAKRKQQFKNIIHQDVLSFDEYASKKTKRQKYPREVDTENVWLKSNFQPKSAGQEYYVSVLNDCTITMCQGPAGCGKTWIATRFALEKLLSKEVEKIIVTKPIMEAGEENKLGALPGFLEEKCLPHFQSILDSFEAHLGPSMLKKLMDLNKIQFIPTAFCRGRNFSDSYILVDEGQNLTKKGIKLLMTRISEGSFMSINGDTDQIDLPRTNESGFVWAIEKLTGKDPDIGVVRLEFDDIQRHPLIKTLLTHLR